MIAELSIKQRGFSKVRDPAETEPFYEAKFLIIGEGRVGKNSNNEVFNLTIRDLITNYELVLATQKPAQLSNPVLKTLV